MACTLHGVLLWCIHVLVVLMSWGVVEGGCGRVARGSTLKGENFLTQGLLMDSEHDISIIKEGYTTKLSFLSE